MSDMAVLCQLRIGNYSGDLTELSQVAWELNRRNQHPWWRTGLSQQPYWNWRIPRFLALPLREKSLSRSSRRKG